MISEEKGEPATYSLLDIRISDVCKDGNEEREQYFALSFKLLFFSLESGESSLGSFFNGRIERIIGAGSDFSSHLLTDSERLVAKLLDVELG